MDNNNANIDIHPPSTSPKVWKARLDSVESEFLTIIKQTSSENPASRKLRILRLNIFNTVMSMIIRHHGEDRMVVDPGAQVWKVRCHDLQDEILAIVRSFAWGNPNSKKIALLRFRCEQMAMINTKFYLMEEMEP